MVSMSQEKAWKEQTLSHLLLDQQLLGSIASHSHGDYKQAKWYLKTVGKTHVRESTLSLNKLLIECVRTRILTHRHEINMGLTLIKGTCEEEALLGLSTALFMDTEPLREGLAAHPKHGGGHGVGWGLANYGWTTSWLCTARELRMVSMLFNDFFKKSKDEHSISWHVDIIWNVIYHVPQGSCIWTQPHLCVYSSFAAVSCCNCKTKQLWQIIWPANLHIFLTWLLLISLLTLV